MSLYLCNVNKTEYAVRIIKGTPEDKIVEVEFLSRTEGGKGRLPGNKEVSLKDLLPLVDAALVK